MHEPRLSPCIFGCRGAADCIQHYFVCPRAHNALFYAVRKSGIFKGHPPASFPSSWASYKMSLAHDSLRPFLFCVLCICTLSHAYHVLKNQYIGLVASWRSRGDLAAIAEVTISVYRASFDKMSVQIKLSQAWELDSELARDASRSGALISTATAAEINHAICKHLLILVNVFLV